MYAQEKCAEILKSVAVAVLQNIIVQFVATMELHILICHTYGARINVIIQVSFIYVY